MDTKWTAAYLTLWLVGSLLILHYGFHGGSDATAIIVFTVVAVVSMTLVVLTRRHLRNR